MLALREVLGFSATEVAAMLGISAAAVKSTLQRARARIKEAAPEPDSIIEPTEPRARELLDWYMSGFEHADIAALERALRADAAIELVGTPTWFAGRATCPALSRTRDRITRGLARMRPTVANGQPATVTYHGVGDGTYQALGVAVLTVTPTGITRMTVFGGGPGLVAKFDLPSTTLDTRDGQRSARCP